MIDLSGKVALVTGSSRGIGYAIAKQLAACGASIVVNSRTAQAKQEVLKTFHSMGYSDVLFLPADITKEVEVRDLINGVLSHHQRLDILVNNAGGTTRGSLMTLPSDSYDDMQALNARSAYYATKAVLRTMIRQQWGRIINIASIAGVRGMAMQGHYATAKAALIGLSKSLAQEFGSKGITCNVVAPGTVRTDSTLYSAHEEEQAIQLTPMRRIGTPEDVASAVTFLSSDAASFITGQVLRVDGGMWM